MTADLARKAARGQTSPRACPEENDVKMNEIVDKVVLAPEVKQFTIRAPLIARKAQAGQFVVLRVNETGERIPLTLADRDPEAGTITIVVQEVGKTTRLLGQLEAGDALADVIGPLGVPSEIEQFGTVVCIGGGVGIACIYPIAKALKEAGNRVVSIIGARTKSLLTWEDRMREVSDDLRVTTDDGSYGHKGFVTDELKGLIEDGTPIVLVYAVGPAVMMRAVAEVTRPHELRTIVSLNSIMIDGTGMCGGCRVGIGGETRFVCVHGPEFDAHQVDFGELMQRQRIYLDEEKLAAEGLEARCSSACS